MGAAEIGGFQVFWSVSLDRMTGTRFHERLQKKTSSINLWFPQTNTHTHTLVNRAGDIVQ